ncbi:MAG TPA: MipA/OmpV family protein [Burkholderiaceae bacterium]|nr:MipA/OmpV family protein [Burkholderiaceae bacterium]
MPWLPLRRARRIATAAALAVAAGCSGTAVAKAAPPVWEWGLGAGVLRAPDYRGADVNHGYLLPIVYLRYRGEFLRLDREGLRALLFDRDRLDLDLSLDAHPALRTDRNPARLGMPRLRPTLELGPELSYRVAGAPGPDAKALYARVSLRAVYSVGDRFLPVHRGWNLTPNLRLQWPSPATGWDVRVTVGPMFGDRQYHDYFYGVPPEQALPQRPAYRASAGYSGLMSTVSASRRFGDWWVGAFVRADALRGAAFEDSPLVRRRSFVSAGVGFAYIFGRSRP